MVQRLIAIFSAAFFLAACETASTTSSDSASDSASSSASGASTASASSSGSSASASSSSADDAMTPAEKLARVGNTVYFDFDSAALSYDAQVTLSRQSAFLQLNPEAVVVIEGHADERGTREYNLALGDRRASAARDFLLAKGIDAARIRTVSYGKERPLMSGSNETSWAKNRRAATVLN
ncbi:MAG: peptidoglycan-associated lipoprotein Pal [Candidatus Puniceispirillum sp.]|jgi:peptidoglycan-associated lipoprotein|uniref:peptidoglycan-associated lipoprotein Pal n=1 Tax=Candidatus Puniceispirillum sp. TaxID=2026719 RepID=UPI001ED1CFAC|nr:peptidoglycan-associated lipoprotein Pal [Candidatus Puniceispirillum sp.]MBT6415547.1 peptidoglycan-associated lipoprotein Pal [Candidatus Puniceispirillum sp.]MBT6566212.1 peptidoglycan-associated lipoprotein Pal [Candidatus Puniceispirillum sp.]